MPLSETDRECFDQFWNKNWNVPIQTAVDLLPLALRALKSAWACDPKCNCEICRVLALAAEKGMVIP